MFLHKFSYTSPFYIPSTTICPSFPYSSPLIIPASSAVLQCPSLSYFSTCKRASYLLSPFPSTSPLSSLTFLPPSSRIPCPSLPLSQLARLSLPSLLSRRQPPFLFPFISPLVLSVLPSRLSFLPSPSYYIPHVRLSFSFSLIHYILYLPSSATASTSSTTSTCSSSSSSPYPVPS